jgi:hypothetical protein
MVGESLLNRIKQGYTFKIKEGKSHAVPKEYIEATERYSGQVRLGRDGQLLNYMAGHPFPQFRPDDPEAGLKLAWNLYWRWLGDDYKSGGNMKEGKVISYTIERDGSERRADNVSLTIRPRSRVTLNPKPVIPGYEHIDWMNVRANEYPRDSSGTVTLEIRYADPKVEDDIYIFVPSLRRIRRAPTVHRCATLAPTEFNYDDVNSFNGKVTDFRYRFLGEKKVLGNRSQERLPFRRKTGDYLPVDEGWEVRDAFVLEITPKDPSYCYPKKVIYIDKLHFEVSWFMMWDKDGNYLKEAFSFYVPVKLPDGQLVSSVGTVVIVNVQNGRSTALTAARNYNLDYKPTLFSLATLQQVMRGGSIR